MKRTRQILGLLVCGMMLAGCFSSAAKEPSISYPTEKKTTSIEKKASSTERELEEIEASLQEKEDSERKEQERIASEQASLEKAKKEKEEREAARLQSEMEAASRAAEESRVAEEQRAAEEQAQEAIQPAPQETTQGTDQGTASGTYTSGGLRFFGGAAGAGGDQSGDQGSGGYAAYEPDPNTGYGHRCNDGTSAPYDADPSAPGRANACYGHGGFAY
ncbi:hypothetical protein IM774_04590 [Erysipelotrichaceae bacterium RD49]|nr:hypothetical protein [Erysipelotrichaceae bacterium RD49]